MTKKAEPYMEGALATLEQNNVKYSQMKFVNPFVTWAK